MSAFAVIPFRWLGHRLFVRAVFADGRWMWAADDVRRAVAAAVAVPASVSVELGGEDGWLDLWSPEAVRLVLELSGADPSLAGEFRDWFEALAADLAVKGRALADEVTGLRPPAPRGLSADLVVRALNDDPLIRARSKGQLYDELERLGWCDRTLDGRRTPSERAQRDGLLVGQAVRTPAGIRTQVLVTEHGLERLRWELIRMDEAALLVPRSGAVR